MRKILAVAWNDAFIFLQSPANWMQLTVIPAAFILIMGLALGGSSGQANSQLLVDVVDEDASAQSQALIAAIEAENPNFTLCPASNDDANLCQLEGDFSAAQAHSRLTERVTFATLVIPQGYGAALQNGDAVELVYRADSDLNAPQVVLQTIQSVIVRVGGAAVAAQLSTETAQSLGLAADDADRETFYAARYAEAEAAWGPPAPITIESETTEGASESPGTGFGQSAPGMASMFVMMNVLGLAASLVQERQNGTLSRLIMMPVTRAHILGGKILRGFALGVFQYSLMLIFGALLGVKFGDNILALALLVICYALAVTALALAMATMVRTPDQAGGIGLLAVMVLAPLGGAWWPLGIVPQAMQVIGHLSPIAWAMEAFQSLIYYGGGLQDVIVPCLVLLGFAAVFFAFGIARFRYE